MERQQHGKRRRLYRHQVAAVNRLLTKGGAKTPWNERNASLLAVHEMGTGKTITAILGLAAVHQIAPPHVPKRSLVVCPLSVLRVWEDTLRAWTTLGETLLVAHADDLVPVQNQPQWPGISYHSTAPLAEPKPPPRQP